MGYRMRFIVEKRRNAFVVVDTFLKKVISLHRSQEDADLEAAQLNRDNPDPRPSNRVWNVEIGETREKMEFLLDDGFEPFSADRGKIYFRKLVSALP